MSSTELTTSLTEEALAAVATSDLLGDEDQINVPLLKVGQSLTNEVVEGDAIAGEFIHSLTGESLGKTVQLIVVDAFKGRAWKDKDDNLRTANREPVVPWEDNPCYGQHFVDCAEAEEQYRARVRANEIDWGKGPSISTTYNFVGLLIDENGEVAEVPVRLSLMRALAKEGRNWSTMLRLSRAPWDKVFEVSTVDARSKAGQPFKSVKVKQLRPTTPEQRAAAVAIATALQAGSAVRYEEGESVEDAAPVKEEARGGIAV